MTRVVVTLWRRYLYGCRGAIVHIWLSPRLFSLQQFSMMYRETRRTVFVRHIRRHFVGKSTNLPLLSYFLNYGSSLLLVLLYVQAFQLQYEHPNSVVSISGSTANERRRSGAHPLRSLSSNLLTPTNDSSANPSPDSSLVC
jgi:hypothetical protein